jgi:ABC-type multidrug transport system fused ATPase/permease subunit
MNNNEYIFDVKENENIENIVHDNNINILMVIIKGLITGFLIAYLIILGLRPAALYPDNILEIIENPWIFIILIIINFYVIQWDLTIGLLMFLSIIALLLDIIIFTEGKIFFNKEEAENYSNNVNNVNKISSNTKLSIPEKASSIIYKSYKDINDIIIDNIKKYKDINYDKKTSINIFI